MSQDLLRRTWMDKSDSRQPRAPASNLVNHSIAGILEFFQMGIDFTDLKCDVMKAWASFFQELVDNPMILHRVARSLTGCPIDIGRVHRLNDFQVEVTGQDEEVMHVSNQLGLTGMRNHTFCSFVSINEVLDRSLNFGIELLARQLATQSRTISVDTDRVVRPHNSQMVYTLDKSILSPVHDRLSSSHTS